MVRSQKKRANPKKRGRFNLDLKEGVAMRPEKKPAPTNLVDFYNSNSEDRSKYILEKLLKVSSQPISKQEEDYLSDWEDSVEFAKYDAKKDFEKEWDSSLYLDGKQKEDDFDDWKDSEEFAKYDAGEELVQQNKASLQPISKQEKDNLDDWKDSKEFVEQNIKKKIGVSKEAIQNMKDSTKGQKGSLHYFSRAPALNDSSNPTQISTRLMPSFYSSYPAPNPKVIKPTTDLSSSSSEDTSMKLQATMKVDTLNEWNDYSQVFMQQEQEVFKSKFTVGDLEPLSKLAIEEELDSPIIKVLGEKYSSFRQISKDGNCFYRSFMFSYLEYIIMTRSSVEANRLVLNIEKCRNVHRKLGDDEQRFEHRFTALRELLSHILQPELEDSSDEELLDICRDPFISDAIVGFFRLLTAIEIRSREEFFQPFVLPKTVDKFCAEEVVEMGEYADQWQIVALSDALAVPVEIVCVDQRISSSGEVELSTHVFLNPESTEAQTSTNPAQRTPVPKVTLLYTTGHYEIIYPK